MLKVCCAFLEMLCVFSAVCSFAAQEYSKEDLDSANEHMRLFIEETDERRADLYYALSEVSDGWRGASEDSMEVRTAVVVSTARIMAYSLVVQSYFLCSSVHEKFAGQYNAIVCSLFDGLDFREKIEADKKTFAQVLGAFTGTADGERVGRLYAALCRIVLMYSELQKERVLYNDMATVCRKRQEMFSCKGCVPWYGELVKMFKNFDKEWKRVNAEEDLDKQSPMYRLVSTYGELCRVLLVDSALNMYAYGMMQDESRRTVCDADLVQYMRKRVERLRSEAENGVRTFRRFPVGEKDLPLQKCKDMLESIHAALLVTIETALQ